MKSFINKQVIQLIMAGTFTHQSIDWRKRWNVSCSKYRFATSILRHIMSDSQVVLNVCVQEFKISHMGMQCNKNLVPIIICIYLLVVLLTHGCQKVFIPLAKGIMPIKEILLAGLEVLTCAIAGQQ